jgi:hypothetical protein
VVVTAEVTTHFLEEEPDLLHMKFILRKTRLLHGFVTSQLTPGVFTTMSVLRQQHSLLQWRKRTFDTNAGNRQESRMTRTIPAVMLAGILLVFLSCQEHGFPVRGTAFAAEQAAGKCATCGKTITPDSNHLVASDGKIYCSNKCFQDSLPLCSLCGKRISQTVTIQGGATRRVFCRACAQKPQCFCCAMPANCSKLDDDRLICPECLKTAVFDAKEIVAVAEEVRQKMKDKLNMFTDHQIRFLRASVTDLDGTTAGRSDIPELGRYLFEELSERTITTTTRGKVTSRVKDEKVTATYTIYLLYGLTRDRLVEVAAHELAHDWMQANYPGIEDLKIREGWAEYTASLVNSIYGRDYMNTRMNENPSKIYGDGYRMVLAAARNGTAELGKLFDKYNKTSSAK